jgi:hypothetical protein
MAWTESGLFFATWRDMLKNVIAADLTLTSQKISLVDNSVTPDFISGTDPSTWSNTGELTGTGWVTGGIALSAAAAGGTSAAPTVTQSPSKTLMWDMGNIAVSGTTVGPAFGAYFYFDSLAPKAISLGLFFGGVGYSTLAGGTWTITGAGLRHYRHGHLRKVTQSDRLHDDPAEVWQAGPIAYRAAGVATVGWPAGSQRHHPAVPGGSASGASGAAGSIQPWFPAGFWQRQGQHAKIIAHGVCGATAQAQTLTFAFGTSGSTPQTLSPTTVVATNTFLTSPAYSMAIAQTNAPWHFELDLLCTKVGVGTTAVSTSILTTGTGGITPAVVPAVGAVPLYGPMPGAVITTFDASINQFFWASATYSVSGAANTATMLSCYIYGMN